MKALSDFINMTRKPWLDALRGLAILLVVYGHCINGMTSYYVFTSPVKMPLFFAITGYVFNVNGGSKKFINQLVKKVVIPWLALGLIPVLFFIPFNGFGYFWNYFLMLLSGQKLWFMPCFIIAEIIHYFIRRYLQLDLSIIIASLFCFAAGIVLSNNCILDYAMFNRALTVQPFFLIGYFFNKYEDVFMKIKWWVIIFAFVIYLLLCFMGMKIYPGEVIDVHNNRYFNVPFCLILIMLGCLILFTSASKMQFKSTIMSIIGQNTLVLYCLHSYSFLILNVCLIMISFEMPVTWYSALIELIWATIICGLLALLINRYLPELVGKKRIDKTQNKYKQ